MIFLQLREAACTDAQRTYGRAVQAAQGGWGPVSCVRRDCASCGCVVGAHGGHVLVNRYLAAS